MTALLADCGQLEGEVVLRYDEESPFVRAVREREARNALRARARDTGVRILIVGLDGADWQIAEPLIAEGLLPNLASLQHVDETTPLRIRTAADSPTMAAVEAEMLERKSTRIMVHRWQIWERFTGATVEPTTRCRC